MRCLGSSSLDCGVRWRSWGKGQKGSSGEPGFQFKVSRKAGSTFMIAHIIEILAAWITSVISAAGYGGVMLLMAIESACIPLPSEIIMPFSGYLVYTGRFSLLAVATWGAIGCNVGSILADEGGYLRGAGRAGP